MNYFNNTIAAISTAQIAAGIAVIRISGSEAVKIADHIFVAYKKTEVQSMQGYTCAYGFIKDKDQTKIDDVVLTLFKCPHSYTGEDVVEISCHGGVVITKKILDIVLSAGATLALPGEFTKRAFLNKKIDLTKAEAVIDIINASSEKAVSLAENAYNGAVFKKIKAISNTIAELSAHLEAWADYPDEDIESIEASQLIQNIESCKLKLEELIKNYDNGKIIKNGIDTTIIGKANVGKSTFMNLLSGFDRSIVTDIPGTTRDTVEEKIVISDMILNLSDTAGIRDTEDIIEKIGVEKSWEKIKSADLIISVFDYSEKLSQKDIDIINNIKNAPVIAVINKTDLEKQLDCEYIQNSFKNVVFMAAELQEGLNDFKEALKSAFDLSFAESSEAVMLNERQKQAVLKAYENMKKAQEALDLGFTFDAVTVCLEDAMDCLLELTGEKVSDVIVDKIFSRFCVGK